MRNRLTLLAALSCTSLSAKASAQELKADFEVYGTLVPFLEYTDTDGATQSGDGGDTDLVPDGAYSGINEPARFRMTQGTTHLGFRGSLDLMGDALKVIWQIESGVPLDGDPVLNTFASRNSRVGVTGFWGTVFFGIWDSPYKWASLPLINPLRAGFVPDYNAVMNTPGFNVGALNLSPSYVANAVPGPSPVPRSNAAFYRRDANVVQYWSPQLFGLSARASYTVNEFTSSTGPSSSISPDVLALLVSYDQGPLSLRYAIEVHRDYFGLSLLGGAPGGTAENPSSQDVGQQGVASYKLAWSEDLVTRLVANVDYLHYESDDSVRGNVDQYSRVAFYVLLEQSYGPHHVWGAYGEALAGSCSFVGNDGCSTDGLGARQMTVGYLFRASPVTDFYAVGQQVVNNKSASYGPFPPIDPLPAPGANVRSIGIGMLHRFSFTHSTGD